MCISCTCITFGFFVGGAVRSGVLKLSLGVIVSKTVKGKENVPHYKQKRKRDRNGIGIEMNEYMAFTYYQNMPRLTWTQNTMLCKSTCDVSQGERFRYDYAYGIIATAIE
ncbi:hypothetical protein F8M41_001683 [Gigaspora margarita]|uniref:Uncharacterized protein n=1 Tax=Gigaspora margarita TaxID=4874 RepID=A0A8H3XE31_GIGMA|nr:hypothetical protein F8M41_001683 [Gigaspora margarita]